MGGGGGGGGGALPGECTCVLAALSRNKLPLFSSLAPQALPFPIPASLVELLVTSRPDSLIDRGVAESTLKSYAAGKKRYFTFFFTV